nr:Chain C, HTLV-1 OCTAMERIC TAX PEPTIDE1DUY_F Chain F, HTLV-1 OCTAMERIC TAX PEPTIDE
LFGYPVYV